jgi:hypothetical protein
MSLTHWQTGGSRNGTARVSCGFPAENSRLEWWAFVTNPPSLPMPYRVPRHTPFAGTQLFRPADVMIAVNPPATPVALDHDVAFQKFRSVDFPAGNPEKPRHRSPCSQGSAALRPVAIWGPFPDGLRPRSRFFRLPADASLSFPLSPVRRPAAGGAGR